MAQPIPTSQEPVAGAAICAFFAMTMAFSSASASVTQIRTAAQSGTEPKFIALLQKDNAPVAGLCIDIHRAIERLEPSLRFVGDQAYQPAARVEAAVMSGALDAACGFSRTAERDAKLVYAGPPLFVVKYFLAARADDPVRIDSWDDVRALGKNGTILISHGFGPAARLRGDAGLHIDAGAVDALGNLRKLVAGRGRFYYHRSPGLESDIRKSGLEGKVRILPAVMDVQPFYMALGRSVQPEVAEKIERAIITLARTGELSQLSKKWMSP